MLIDDSGRTESRQAQSNTTQHSNQSTGIVMWLDIVKLILKQKGKNYWTIKDIVQTINDFQLLRTQRPTSTNKVFLFEWKTINYQAYLIYLNTCF